MTDKKKTGITSEQAAALFLSDGRTTDVQMAAILDQNAQNELDMDALQRAHLRRMMGVDFRIKVKPNKIHVSTKEDPYVTTWCRVFEGDVIETPSGFGVTNEKIIDRLVDACLRLKLKYEAEKAKTNEIL